MSPEKRSGNGNNGEQLPLWDTGEDQLFDMSQFERDQIFNDRTNKLHEAILALANGATLEQVREILEQNS